MSVNGPKFHIDVTATTLEQSMQLAMEAGETPLYDEIIKESPMLHDGTPQDLPLAHNSRATGDELDIVAAARTEPVLEDNDGESVGHQSEV